MRARVVSNRQPTATQEIFSLLSLTKTLKRKIPARIESINTCTRVRRLCPATTHADPCRPEPPGRLAAGNEYDGQGLLHPRPEERVPGVETGTTSRSREHGRRQARLHRLAQLPAALRGRRRDRGALGRTCSRRSPGSNRIRPTSGGSSSRCTSACRATASASPTSARGVRAGCRRGHRSRARRRRDAGEAQGHAQDHRRRERRRADRPALVHHGRRDDRDRRADRLPADLPAARRRGPDHRRADPVAAVFDRATTPGSTRRPGASSGSPCSPATTA
jgi:hypothetical protein